MAKLPEELNNKHVGYKLNDQDLTESSFEKVKLGEIITPYLKNVKVIQNVTDNLREKLEHIDNNLITNISDLNTTPSNLEREVISRAIMEIKLYYGKELERSIETYFVLSGSPSFFCFQRGYRFS